MYEWRCDSAKINKVGPDFLSIDKASGGHFSQDLCCGFETVN